MRYRRRTFRSRRGVRRPGMLMLPISKTGITQTWEPRPNNPLLMPTDGFQLSVAMQGNESLPTFLSADPGRPEVVTQQTLRRSLSVAGLRFYWSIAPNEVQSRRDGDSEAVHEVRLAVTVTKVDSLGQAEFIPNLWSDLGHDLGDVLWRGAAYLYQPTLNGGAFGDPVTGAWGPSAAGSQLAFQATAGNYANAFGHYPPVHVKTRRRLKDDEALFMWVSVANNSWPPFGFPEGTPDTIHTTLSIYGVAAVRSNSR